MADQYGEYVAVDDLHLNGRLMLGEENTADNDGVKIAYLALMEAIRNQPRDLIDGFTPEQQFFLGYAQIWCQNQTDQVARLLTQTDSHAPWKRARQRSGVELGTISAGVRVQGRGPHGPSERVPHMVAVVHPIAPPSRK